ncbi:MAG: MoxR family ATPase [Proteobacteria bacterium]|nr:MoxR family ATPase [Pseudomonadota bacterium]
MIPVIYGRIKNELAKVYVGESRIIKALCVALFTGGHVLLEGVPGLAKTTLARGMSTLIGGEFSRIQFASDLMPSDITGTSVYRIDRGEFKFIPGPIFGNVILADEINRAPARTQGALLEAMQENQVTVDGVRHPMPQPYFVIATQNQQDERGTYPLPESQLDRFMFRICLGYPTEREEKQIIVQQMMPEPELEPVLELENIIEFQKRARKILVSDSIVQYITDLIRYSRKMPGVVRGASPRAGAMLLRASRGYALLRDRDYVTPDDVNVALPLVLNHRVILENEEDSVEEFIFKLLETVEYK